MLEKMFDMDKVWELVKEGFGEIGVERDEDNACYYLSFEWEHETLGQEERFFATVMIQDDGDMEIVDSFAGKK